MKNIPKFLQSQEMPREHSANTHEGWGNIAKKDFLHVYSIVLTKLKYLAPLT